MASWLKERRGKGFANQICTCSSCRLRFVCCLSGSAHLPAKTYLQIGSDLQQVLLSPQGQVSATRPHPTPSTMWGVANVTSAPTNSSPMGPAASL